jgi:hypothetical protein
MKIYFLLISIIFASCSSNIDDRSNEKKINAITSKNVIDSIVKVKSSKSIPKEASPKDHPIYTLFRIDSLRDKIGEITRIDSISHKPYKIIHFTFRKGRKNKHSGWEFPYGNGWVLVENYEKNPKLLGFDLEYGDFTAHTFSWIDFDGDGDLDLYTFSGYEDVFSSKLFLNRNNEFKIVYSNTLTYCPLIDIDSDGLPEILSHDSNSEVGLNVTKDDFIKAGQEYDRIVGDFNKNNFDYGLQNDNKLVSLGLTASVRILKIQNDSIKDISADYPQHFCYRSKILSEIKNPDSKVKYRIEELIEEYNFKYGCGK